MNKCSGFTFQSWQVWSSYGYLCVSINWSGCPFLRFPSFFPSTCFPIFIVLPRRLVFYAASFATNIKNFANIRRLVQLRLPWCLLLCTLAIGAYCQSFPICPFLVWGEATVGVIICYLLPKDAQKIYKCGDVISPYFSVAAFAAH